MRYCKHTRWLGLAALNGNVTLQSTDKLSTIVEDLPDPDDQSPSLFVFIGNKSKAMAIKELAKTFSPPPRYVDDHCRGDELERLGQAKLNGRRGHGEIHLHIHAPSTFSSRPVLLAEGDFSSVAKLTDAMATEKCHEMASRPFNSKAPSTANFSQYADRIYFQLLSPFTDVFCFFADDVGKFKAIVERLALWLDLSRPSSLPKCTRPKILIVTEPGEDYKGSDKSDLVVFNQMLSRETTMDVSEQFSEIRILSLPARNKNLSNKARHRELFECLLNFSDQVRDARIKSQTLFSARHFAAFFHYAVEHVSAASEEPFDFISASRFENPVAKQLRGHLTNFLRTIKTPRKLQHFAIPVIASSFLLDSYPPDMHFFSPLEVFRTLYRDTCRQVCRTGVLAHAGSTHMILPSGFITLLEAEFARQVEKFAENSDESSSMWHQRMLSSFRLDWSKIHLNDTCLVCIRERPLYRLSCGHVLCHDCVCRHGDRGDARTYHVHRCFLCQIETPGICIAQKPPTATLKILTIDGGGARGIIPLTFLRALEERIGLPYPVQENFHLIVGSSSGGISTLALGWKGLSVEDSIAQFERLAYEVFYRDLISYLRATLIFITDCIYPAKRLEAALKEILGSNESILDYSSATATGIKIGVVASTMKPEPFLFTNYNGLGDREDNKHKNYRVLLGNALVWEIARCTSAAPGIFTPKKIAGLGKFQDGGLTHNNPMKLALDQAKVLCPNDPGAKRSSLKVSLGTGRAPDRDPEMYGSSSWWKDLWFFRLFRALLFSIDRQESGVVHGDETNGHSKEHTIGEKKKRGEYYRFDVIFPGRQPRLDDPTKMPEMKALAEEEVLESPEMDRLAYCLIAEFFVFELEPESLPRKENGRYSYTGYILCCHRASTPVFNKLLGRLTKKSAQFLLRGRPLLGCVTDRSYFARDGNFRKRVCFDVTSEDELVSLQLQENGSEPCNISGSPFSVNWLIKAQGLKQPFGRSDGTKRKRKGISGKPTKRQRRRLERMQ